MWISIKPSDTLYFRGTRPFTKGEDNFSDFIFPPYPSTFYGLIKTNILFNFGSIEEFKANKHKYQKLLTEDSIEIRGPFIKDKYFFYFPVPKDLVEVNGDRKAVLKVIKPSLFIKEDNFENIFYWNGVGIVEDESGFINSTYLEKYLNNSNCDFSIEKDIYETEYKVGIKRNYSTLTSEDHNLYSIPMIRMKEDLEFLLEINNVDENIIEFFSTSTFGGEGKVVFLRKEADVKFENIIDINAQTKNKINEDKKFKIYLATPAIFEKGWLPKWIDENNMEGKFEGIRLKLVSCSIGKYIRIGGWDMAKNEPKPVKKAVPAGSVYVFEILDSNKTADDIMEVFHFKNISDKYPKQGFGLSLAGGVQ